MSFISKEKYKELEKELKFLETTKRQEIAQRLRSAKEMGDLSENSEYSQAREEEAMLERRIAEIKKILRESEIIKGGKKKGIISLGSVVKVESGKKVYTYRIVGSHEANVAKRLISDESPLGKAFLGKKEKEEVIVETPSGKKKYKILEVK